MFRRTNNRREFLKITGLTGLSMTGFSALGNWLHDPLSESNITMNNLDNPSRNLIGQYGEWASSLTSNRVPALSFRDSEWKDVDAWRKAAQWRVMERMAIPDLGKIPEVIIHKQQTYDGLHIEHLSWQLPYGNPTDGILLRPSNASGPLPGILAFHDHGGNKYFGTRKITRTQDPIHPLMETHQKEYYEGLAWANEIAKKGYVVLVSDAFPFASRRVMLKDVPPHLAHGLTDQDPENPKNIVAYNEWAGQHEHIMAKSLFSAGTTWPGVFFAEDRMALNILCARPEVDASRIGCGGLSGGGMRTAFMAGLDPRIKCAVCVGFMTTWKDFVLNKSYTHTWMVYVPLLPNELDFPEIIGLRAPLPTLVLNDTEDDLYTMEGMRQADSILKEVYAKAGASGNYKASFHPGPHKFDRKMQTEAFQWFDRWLKNG